MLIRRRALHQRATRPTQYHPKPSTVTVVHMRWLCRCPAACPPPPLPLQVKGWNMAEVAQYAALVDLGRVRGPGGGGEGGRLRQAAVA